VSGLDFEELLYGDETGSVCLDRIASGSEVGKDGLAFGIGGFSSDVGALSACDAQIHQTAERRVVKKAQANFQGRRLCIRSMRRDGAFFGTLLRAEDTAYQKSRQREQQTGDKTESMDNSLQIPSSEHEVQKQAATAPERNGNKPLRQFSPMYQEDAMNIAYAWERSVSMNCPMQRIKPTLSEGARG
jgi:hypothetical protein